MKMDDIRTLIKNAMHNVYGFSPAKNAIVPLESSGYGNTIEWLAFAVGGKGYTYDVRDNELVKDPAYDMKGV